MINKFIGIGNLCDNPTLRRTNSDQAVVDFSIAMNEKWTDKQGQKQEKVEYLKCILWGKQADICNKYLNKGSKIYIEGKLQTRSWEDKQGAKRYTTEVVGNVVKFLDGKAQETSNIGASSATKAQNMAEHVFKTDPEFDEVPF